MARYPTFDEYARTGKYAEGIKRCDELLSRSPKDATLLITKLQLLAASQQDVSQVLAQLLEHPHTITDFNELVAIEAAVVDSTKNVYPRPLSAGPSVSKLWENAFKASTASKYKISLIEVRFDRAVTDGRLQDVQQTLIMLKAFQPKNRAVYMAHAAYTQLLSSSKDDLQSKLAIGLARKAVSEKFDDDQSLDCRVPGQIFAIQRAEKDLKGIENRSFRESQQVYKALKLSEPIKIAPPEASQEGGDPTKVSSREWLFAEVESLKQEFQGLLNGGASSESLGKFVVNAVELFNTATTSLNLGERNRGAADAIFLAVSALVKLFADSSDRAYLLKAAYLVDKLLTFNSHIHEARLILVYLYMMLNLGSLAMRLFDSLNVKEIQHDTVGHVLFSELSTVHPFRTNLVGKDFYDPHEKTQKALGVYPRHEDKLSETESAILNHSQTGMIFDLQELRKNLRDSLPRRMFLLEHRRISRLTGKSYGKNSSEIGPRVVANWTNTVDNRDFNAAFDYGLNVEKALYSHADSDLFANLATDTAWSLASKQTPLILDPENLPSPTSSSATPQSLAFQIALTIIPLLTSPSPSREGVQTLLAQLKRLPIESLIQSPDPSLATHLPDHFIYMDILLIAQQACRHIKDTATHIPMEVAQVGDFCRKGVQVLHGSAVEKGAAVKGASVKASLVGGVLEGLDAEGDVDAFVEKVVASAKEGWEGVTRISVS